ncbi:MAG: hypothetical protein ACKVYV_04165 [Limisphaerales bacterium]
MSEKLDWSPATGPQHPSEVTDAFRRIQRYAIQNPRRGISSAIGWSLKRKERQEHIHRTSEGFQICYTVCEKASNVAHTVSGKSRMLSLNDQIESMLIILLELNRQFARAGFAARLDASSLKRSFTGTLFVEFSLDRVEHDQFIKSLDELLLSNSLRSPP